MLPVRVTRAPISLWGLGTINQIFNTYHGVPFIFFQTMGVQIFLAKLYNFVDFKFFVLHFEVFDFEVFVFEVFDFEVFDFEVFDFEVFDFEVFNFEVFDFEVFFQKV